MSPGIAVFGSSITEPGSTDWEEAHRVGTRLARAGLAVVTGGYEGTMLAVSQGASEAGGHVIGVTASRLFPHRPGANRYVEEVVDATSLGQRIDIMMDRAEAAIALPGSIGTAAELVLAWNVNYIARHNGVPTVPTAAVGEAWRVVGRALIEAAAALPDYIQWVDTGDDAVDWVLARLV